MIIASSKTNAWNILCQRQNALIAATALAMSVIFAISKAPTSNDTPRLNRRRFGLKQKTVQRLCDKRHA
ncbi:hypothetical protein [Rhizobium leguminosarum]|uniref:hypothetical protein n=1 Tax=Rhizobium leguminosarum TaxID=384 RepID=UPI001C904895|nr:hypothetical protein [Rhizobium leguminosarum]MBY3174179.1 hypothetical protein [Rhizobium leguminosarum]MBY5521528.1 hypothetical protein [Rhizobium leguminosarum]MBY5549311.1 hypothetical protein [Rhizobium leguminosarum]MBY5561481.1 hypothetical protein [Rhizobium leguminosarum]MBY5586413.1 hypothetical protein [Rhizobium leguminosarum]